MASVSYLFGEPPDPPGEVQIVCPTCSGEYFTLWSDGLMQCAVCEEWCELET